MNVATGRAHRFDGADDHQGIVKMRRAAIFDMHLRDRIGALARRMHRALVNANAGEHVRPCALHEVQIARMIDDARKVGVLKINPHSKQVPRAVKMALIGSRDGHQ